MIDLSRRSFFAGLGASLFAAPAIVRAPSLMPLRGVALRIAENMTATEILGLYGRSPLMDAPPLLWQWQAAWEAALPYQIGDLVKCADFCEWIALHG